MTIAPSDALARVEITYEPAPADAPADAPRVFAVVAAVMKDTMPVAKSQENKQQNYSFRGIDDVMSAMAGPMRSHGLFILPSIADHKQQRDGKMTRTLITMRYRVYGPAGDCLVADVPGEAFDFADKSTNKAQSAALKYLLFTLFMLPVDGRSIDDGDRHHPEPSEEHRAEQTQRQQRGKGGQQRQQQPRRSNRAEQGPWEQQAPQQAPPKQRPDYLAEARKATSRAAFDKVRAAAAKAGAPDDYLAQLDAVAAERAQPKQQTPPKAPPTRKPAAQQAPAVDDEHAAALGEMYDAAREAGITDRAEADQTFVNQFRTNPQQATPAQLRSMRDDLLDAARSAAA
ncbi:ERF family protein [Streptomyces sp. NPDC057651]|uniref:ERF family protein n=1 Tax=Streptomyces sp. NPDC057651 TaxID=3346194 RepID=UPI0036B99B6E